MLALVSTVDGSGIVCVLSMLRVMNFCLVVCFQRGGLAIGGRWDRTTESRLMRPRSIRAPPGAFGQGLLGDVQDADLLVASRPVVILAV